MTESNDNSINRESLSFNRQPSCVTTISSLCTIPKRFGYSGTPVTDSLTRKYTGKEITKIYADLSIPVDIQSFSFPYKEIVPYGPLQYKREEGIEENDPAVPIRSEFVSISQVEENGLKNLIIGRTNTKTIGERTYSEETLFTIAYDRETCSYKISFIFATSEPTTYTLSDELIKTLEQDPNSKVLPEIPKMARYSRHRILPNFFVLDLIIQFLNSVLEEDVERGMDTEDIEKIIAILKETHDLQAPNKPDSV